MSEVELLEQRVKLLEEMVTTLSKTILENAQMSAKLASRMKIMHKYFDLQFKILKGEQPTREEVTQLQFENMTDDLRLDFPDDEM